MKRQKHVVRGAGGEGGEGEPKTALKALLRLPLPPLPFPSPHDVGSPLLRH